MATKKSAPEKSVEVSRMVVPTCYIEEDNLDDVIAEQRQRLNNAVSLGNGCYWTRAHAMSDDC